MSNAIDQITDMLKLTLSIFEKYKGSNPVSRISTSAYNNYRGLCTINFTKGGSSYYNNGQTYIDNKPVNLSLPSPICLSLTEQSTKDLLYLLEGNKHPKHYNTPKLLSDIDAGLLYSMSRCYNVMYLQKNSQFELLLDCNFTIQSHNSIQYSAQPFIGDFYIKYDSQNQKVDLRDSTLPPVSVLKYKSSPEDEFVNLPNTIKNNVKISNSDSPLLDLTPKQYKQYIVIHPKYLYQHKYIMVTRQRNVEIDYCKYCADNYNCTGGAKYYFNICEKRMEISYGKQQDSDVVLIPDVVEKIIGSVISVSYKPSSLTNIVGEIEEVKQLILPLNLQLKVEFNY